MALYMGRITSHSADYVPAAVRLSEPGDYRISVRTNRRFYTRGLRQAGLAVTFQCKAESVTCVIFS